MNLLAVCFWISHPEQEFFELLGRSGARLGGSGEWRKNLPGCWSGLDLNFRAPIMREKEGLAQIIRACRSGFAKQLTLLAQH
jgi:hypothetical protein